MPTRTGAPSGAAAAERPTDPRSGDPLPAGLVSTVAERASKNVPWDLDAVVGPIKTRFGGALAGLLLYGSCLRGEDPHDGVVDFYALVDTYRAAYTKRRFRWLNSVLPPNVFYLEAEGPEGTLRAKYAVLSMADFEKGCRTWFHSYVWARFAQPALIVYARDPDTKTRIQSSIAAAALTFLRESATAVEGDEEVEGAAVWNDGLTRAYAAELRAERGRADHLTSVGRADFEALTRAAAPALLDCLEPTPDGRYRITTDDARRRRSRRRWKVRRWQGRVLSILRLAKALFTFENGVEYVVWKIERHSGVELAPTGKVKRFPLLLGPWVLWRLLRNGTVR